MAGTGHGSVYAQHHEPGAASCTSHPSQDPGRDHALLPSTRTKGDVEEERSGKLPTDISPAAPAQLSPGRRGVGDAGAPGERGRGSGGAGASIED